jgi:hypothetical protein
VATDEDVVDWISAAVLEFMRRVGSAMTIATWSRVLDRRQAAGMTPELRHP